MDGGHLHAVISSFPGIFVEGPLARSMLVSHSAMGRYKLVCFCFTVRIVLPFVVSLQRGRRLKQRHEEGAETLHAWQRTRKEVLLG